MSPPGRPKGEYRRAQPEGSRVFPPGRPKGEYRRAQPQGAPVSRLLALLMLCTLAACVQPPLPPPKPQPTPEEVASRQAAEAAAIERAAQEARAAEVAQIAEDAYVYGYPLVLGELKRLLMSNVAKAAGPRAPLNSFWHARRLPPGGEPHPWVVDSDTLVSTAWLDLGREAMLFVQPDMGRRWFDFSVHSLWMQSLVTLGPAEARGARVLLAGPEWQGHVPRGARLVRSPTRYVAIIGRIQTSGSDADLRAVQALQKRLRLVPQTVRMQPGDRRAPSLDSSAVIGPGGTPRQALQALDISAYFNLLARLLGTVAPPAAADAPMLQTMARIGLEPGKPFSADALEPTVQQALRRTPARAAQRLADYRPQLFAAVDGWQVALETGDFGTDYLRRAAVAALAWPGWPAPQQLLQMSTRVDAEGRALSGAHDYLLSFARGRQPPTQAFWSLTLEADDDGRRSFVPNSADRIGLGSRDKLPLDADGALHIQPQYLSPGPDHASRWLPAPKDGFVLTLRLYAPRSTPPSALPPGQGSWSPPPLRRID